MLTENPGLLWEIKEKLRFYLITPRSILLIVAILHLGALILCAIDYYLLKFFIVNYNDGLVSDQQNFELRGESVLSGHWPYENIPREYAIAPPLSMYILAVPLIVEPLIPLPLAFIYRSYLSLFNLASCWMLIKISEKKFPERQGISAALLYGISPILLKEAAFAGSDECLGAFLMILVIFLIIVYDRPFLAALTIGLGASAKYYPVLLIPYLLATRPSRKEQIKYGLIAILAVIMAFLPFYLAQPEGFMYQFEDRVGSVPWDKGGNSGLLILVARIVGSSTATGFSSYTVFWVAITASFSLFQIMANRDALEDAALIPSIFFILYPKFLFAYFIIVLPIYCLSYAHRHSTWTHWSLCHFGLIFAQTMTDRVVGYGSVYSQEPGNVPFLLIVGVCCFFSIWIFQWGLILWKKELRWQKTNSLVLPSICARSFDTD
ncbi:MAG: ArnT family glycosyltransferase [Candidatus Thorarchaeota archaeon]